MIDTTVKYFGRRSPRSFIWVVCFPQSDDVDGTVAVGDLTEMAMAVALGWRVG